MPRIDDPDYKAATVTILDALKARRDVVRRKFEQGFYNDLKLDIYHEPRSGSRRSRFRHPTPRQVMPADGQPHLPPRRARKPPSSLWSGKSNRSKADRAAAPKEIRSGSP
jgi:hypothetical protein